MKICEWLDICCPHCHVDDNLIDGKKCLVTTPTGVAAFHHVTCSNCGVQFLIECAN